MSEIECVNLLAFIQFTIAFDFGLYYLDDKHALTKIYRKYQMDLRASVQAILQRADETIKVSKTLTSCIFATLDKYFSFI